MTGASGALGAAVARELDRRGYLLALHGNNHTERLVPLQLELGNRSLIAMADLRRFDEVAEMAATAEADLGPIQVAVNCAASRCDGLLMVQPQSDWLENIEVNLIGSYHIARAVVPEMVRRQHGRLVFVSSPSAERGHAGQTGYAASKAGVLGLVRSLAQELGRSGITVNAVSPGFMRSEMTQNVSDRQRRALIHNSATRREVDPAEAARVISLVLDSPSLTGQNIRVDGGASA